jgi:hypothetical protein
MAINIHTDQRFEKVLTWLSRQSRKTKTDLLKELVMERFYLKKAGFQFGVFRPAHKRSPKAVQASLKALDFDHDLD